jgi:hypothetical protein
MTEGKYGKYVITKPKLTTELAHHDFTDVSGITFPDEVYLDKENPFDEIVLFIGSDHRDTGDLGGELEWFMGEGEDAEL